MKYKIIERELFRHLEMAVENKLDDGWELQGGVAIIYTGSRCYYAQAMIKRGEVKKNKKPSKKIGSFTLKDFLDSDI